MRFSLSSLAWVSLTWVSSTGFSLTLISPWVALSVALRTALLLIGSGTLLAPARMLGYAHLDAIL